MAVSNFQTFCAENLEFLIFDRTFDADNKRKEL